jgi:hypothetical protein
VRQIRRRSHPQRPGLRVAVDFTARQFNVIGMSRSIWEIPFSLVFLWTVG